MSKKMDVKTYLDQFYVMGIDSILNCDALSQILYAAILNRFRVTFSREEYSYFKEYQERVFNLIEDLREKNSATLGIVLEYLGKHNPCLADIIIMLWSLPRTDDYLSKRIYNNKYRDNIQKFNNKLTKNINHPTIKNFCIETLSKTNYVPVHCIDLIWRYMDTLSIEFNFYNPDSSAYIGITMPNSKKENFIEIGLDMEYILVMGLGNTSYESDAKGPFRNVIKNFVTNENIINKLMASIDKKNYFRQLVNINKNFKKYFNDETDKLLDQKMQEIEKMLL